jgi:hypothetical protein
VGTQPAHQKHQSTRRGKAVRVMSHHDHDFKKNVWTPFLDEVTAISQRHGANPPVGCKSVKELQPLAFFFSLHIYLIASESMHLD